MPTKEFKFRKSSFYPKQYNKYHTKAQYGNYQYPVSYDVINRETGEVVVKAGEKPEVLFFFNGEDFLHDPKNYTRWGIENPTIRDGSKYFTPQDIETDWEIIKDLQAEHDAEDSVKEREAIMEEIIQKKSAVWCKKAKNEGIYDNAVGSLDEEHRATNSISVTQKVEKDSAKRN